MQAALAARYGLQFEHAQLHRELERMAEHSQAPRQLQRLFDALQGDPLRVQECLLRPQRVQAALREAYQNDAALHARPRALSTSRSPIQVGRCEVNWMSPDWCCPKTPGMPCCRR